jgi:hypothetical protein
MFSSNTRVFFSLRPSFVLDRRHRSRIYPPSVLGKERPTPRDSKARAAELLRATHPERVPYASPRQKISSRNLTRRKSLEIRSAVRSDVRLFACDNYRFGEDFNRKSVFRARWSRAVRIAYDLDRRKRHVPSAVCGAFARATNRTFG